MSFKDWFKFGPKKNQDVNVTKIKTKSVEMGAMAAGNLSGAADTISRMVDERTAPTKVLMVQDGDYSQQVTDYALKMAQRLDCEIIALDVTDTPLNFSGDRRTRESERFLAMAKKNAEEFSQNAMAKGIKVEHIMEIGDPESIIAKISDEKVGVRYLLSKPEEVSVNADRERISVPVVDLHCSRL